MFAKSMQGLKPNIVVAPGLSITPKEARQSVPDSLPGGATKAPVISVKVAKVSPLGQNCDCRLCLICEQLLPIPAERD